MLFHVDHPVLQALGIKVRVVDSPIIVHRHRSRDATVRPLQGPIVQVLQRIFSHDNVTFHNQQPRIRLQRLALRFLLYLYGTESFDALIALTVSRVESIESFTGVIMCKPFMKIRDIKYNSQTGRAPSLSRERPTRHTV